ncbi:hypothetical protein ABK040_011298 [Willaertia magna]
MLNTTTIRGGLNNPNANNTNNNNTTNNHFNYDFDKFLTFQQEEITPIDISIGILIYLSQREEEEEQELNHQEELDEKSNNEYSFFEKNDNNNINGNKIIMDKNDKNDNLYKFIIHYISNSEKQLNNNLNNNNLINNSINRNLNTFIEELNNFKISQIIITSYLSMLNQVDTIDNLMNLFDYFKLIISTCVHKNSIFGIFLRKLNLIFNNLLFDGIVKLFQNILNFKNNKNLNLKNNIFKNNYKKYINYCKVLDFNNSIYFLYKYYDYYQNRNYSILNKAILYFHFGYYEQSLISLKETIKICQQNNELECLLISNILFYKIKIINYFTKNNKENEMITIQRLFLNCLKQANSTISFYILNDIIHFYLLTKNGNVNFIFKLLKNCELLQQKLMNEDSYLVKELFPKSVMNITKYYVYSLFGNKNLLNTLQNNLQNKHKIIKLNLEPKQKLFQIIIYFIKIKDIKNIKKYLNIYKNYINLKIDKCDLLYLESLIDYYINNNYLNYNLKINKCLKMAEKYNFLNIFLNYENLNFEILIKLSEEYNLQFYKNRYLLYLYKDINLIENKNDFIKNGNYLDLAIYFECLGECTNIDNIEKINYFKKAIYFYLKNLNLDKCLELIKKCINLENNKKNTLYSNLYCNIYKIYNSFYSFDQFCNNVNTNMVNDYTFDWNFTKEVEYFEYLIVKILNVNSFFLKKGKLKSTTNTIKVI